MIAVYTLTMGIGCLVPGAFADRFGRRPIILAGLGAFTVLTLLTSTLTNFEVLLWVRGATGLLAAGLMVAPMAIVRDLYSGDAMARLMSIIAAVFITVPVRVYATLKNGRHQRFAGQYILRRVNDVDGATREQLSWHLTSATLRPIG